MVVRKRKIRTLLVSALFGTSMLFAGMAGLKPLHAENVNADGEISNDTAFKQAVAVGGSYKLTGDIRFFADYSTITLNGDLELDLNGYTLESGYARNDENSWYAHIETNGHKLTLTSSKQGKGTFFGGVVMTAKNDSFEDSTYSSSLTIRGGVCVDSVFVNSRNFVSANEDHQKPFLEYLGLIDGSINSLTFEKHRLCPKSDYPDYTSNALQSAINEKIAIGSYKVSVKNSPRVANFGEAWKYGSVTKTSAEFKNVSFESYPDDLNTTLTHEELHVDNTKHTVNLRINNAYNNELTYKSYNGKVTSKWYRAKNNSGFEQLKTLSNVFVVDTYMTENNLEFGANAYKYYCVMTGSTSAGKKTMQSETFVYYTKPFAPSEVNIYGTEKVVKKTPVTITGTYKVDSRNFAENIVKQKYQWQKK